MRVPGTRGVPGVVVGFGAAGAAAAAAAIAYELGPSAAIAAVGLVVVALLLLSDARAAVLVAVFAYIGLESQAEWGVPVLARLYDPAAGEFSPVQLALVLAVAAVVIDLIRTNEPVRLPTGFVGPLLLAGGAVAFALVNGRLGGESQSFAQLTFVKSIMPLFVFPLLIVNVVRSPRELRQALGSAGILSIYKAITGLAVVFLGMSTFTDEGPRLTFYAPAANWLLLLTMLTIIAAWLGKVDTPRWLRWAFPLLALCLLLSYRRTFWLAFVLCLLILIPLATGRSGRRLIVPVGLLLAFSGWIVLSSGFAGELQGPLVQRAKSIDPSKVSRNEQDRYRLAERRNVIAEIERHPLAGIGAGVDWKGRYPLNFEYPFGRDYVHVSALWWWLKAGVIGLGAYLWLLISVVVSAYFVWRRHRDPLIATAALAAGVGMFGMLTVELASTVIGPDERGTAAVGIVMGLLAVARGQLFAQEIPAPEVTIRE